MIWKLPIEFSKKEGVFDYINSSYLDYFVTYVLDWRFRESTELRPWIKNQVDNPTEDLINAAKEATATLPTNASTDSIVVACLRYVHNRTTYTPDNKTWGTDEKWQTAQETLMSCKGDCEDGSILMYVLCRLNKVPANRLLINAGGVVSGGHCWLSYRPDEYPLNFIFADWCYYYQDTYPANRNKFYIQDKKILGEDARYQTLWFAFNEDKSYIELKNKYGAK